ncbi:MAG: VOC family protein [Candidatus Rokubacteria bacterium]|nr:VOC family protein [Candidatus Rokubacteria bacterium]
MAVRFDHIAIAVSRIADVTGVLVGALGGEPAFGSSSRFFQFGQWRFAGGGRLEVLEPVGPPDGFLRRFLAQNGPGIHHVTFKVPDIREACARAEGFGYKIVGFDDSNPYWKEAFLHPKQALGIVVQLAQMARTSAGAPSMSWQPPQAPPNPPAPVTVLGLRMTARSRERADVQWRQILQAEPSEAGGEVVYRWERSPLTITVAIDPAAEEGPVAIELATDRAVGIPAGRHPVLGALFVPRQR